MERHLLDEPAIWTRNREMDAESIRKQLVWRNGCLSGPCEDRYGLVARLCDERGD